MPLIPEEIISQVIERCDIVDIVSSYIPLKRAGRSFKANCPFHNEKTPSFVVTPSKQIFHCFGCGVGGNALHFIMRQEHMEFPDAVRMLAKKVNIEIPEKQVSPREQKSMNQRQLLFEVNQLAVDYFHQELLSKGSAANGARQYLKDRGVTLEMVKQFYLGLAKEQWDGLSNYLAKKQVSVTAMEKAGLIISRDSGNGFYDRFRGRIIFPIFDTRGHCRAFGARSLDAQSNTAKYLNSPETLLYTKGHHLYGFHMAKDAIVRQDAVIIVEGYMDCLMPQCSGVNNIVAALGTALTVEQIRLLRRYTKNVYLLFDMDKAGEAAMMRSLDILIEEGMNVMVVTLEQGHDPDSFIRSFGFEAFNERVNNARTLFDFKLYVLLKENDMSTAEGKAVISGDMLGTINKFHDAVVRAEYLRRLSQKLMVPEHALMTELKKIQQSLQKTRYFKREKSQQVCVQPAAYTQNRMVERHILRLLIEEQEFIGLTKKEVTPLDFQDECIRGVITKIYELNEQGKDVNSLSLINSFQDVHVRQMISGLTASEDGPMGDRKQMHRDYINRLKKDRMKLQRQDLLQKIQAAEAQGDNTQLEELKTQFSALQIH